MKIGFLFNHDTGHQAGHLTPILNAYAAARPDDAIIIYLGGATIAEAVRRGLSSQAAAKAELVDLPLPATLMPLATALDAAIPASRWTRLMFNVGKFRDLDALVAPERTSLYIHKRLKREGVSYIHVRHGAGDRAVGFHPSFSKFDLLLLQGEKYARRLRQTGGLSGNEFALVGYPKFDSIDATAQPRLFDNDRPTVVYNPHFSPVYSSWYQLGEPVLDWFADHPEYNLIFAPHVMLFRRRAHVSSDAMKAAWRRRLPDRFYRRPNILIDFASPRLFDMSYMLAADLYLGDVSSQVMEFLIRPRPCVFLNPQRHRWNNDENFASWRLGPVIETLDELEGALQAGLAEPDAYRNLQIAHFRDTFDFSGEPSAMRAAQAIASFLDRKANAGVANDRGVLAEPLLAG